MSKLPLLYRGKDQKWHLVPLHLFITLPDGRRFLPSYNANLTKEGATFVRQARHKLIYALVHDGYYLWEDEKLWEDDNS